MGWPGPPREPVRARVDQDTATRLDKRAEAEGLMLPRGEPNRSEMVRLAIAYALQHMPAGWRP